MFTVYEEGEQMMVGILDEAEGVEWPFHYFGPGTTNEVTLGFVGPPGAAFEVVMGFPGDPPVRFSDGG